MFGSQVFMEYQLWEMCLIVKKINEQLALMYLTILESQDSLVYPQSLQKISGRTHEKIRLPLGLWHGT